MGFRTFLLVGDIDSGIWTGGISDGNFPDPRRILRLPHLLSFLVGLFFGGYCFRETPFMNFLYTTAEQKGRIRNHPHRYLTADTPPGGFRMPCDAIPRR